MAIPLRQSARVGWYLFNQKMRRREKFPLLVELEPLFACNLKCPGCGKIQHPHDLLRQRMPVERAVAAIETIGAPLSSIAATARSTGMRWRKRSCGCWIFPQPGHLRLHANNGSSSTSKGNFLRRRSFWLNRYQPTRADWRSGIAISRQPPSGV